MLATLDFFITMLRTLSQNLQQAGENPSLRDNDHCVKLSLAHEVL